MLCEWVARVGRGFIIKWDYYISHSLTQAMTRGAHGIIGNGHSNLSSNPGQGC